MVNQLYFQIESTFFSSPCDGIGGTIKRLTARTSLQSKKKILTTEDMAEFCQDEVQGVITIYIPSEIVQPGAAK